MELVDENEGYDSEDDENETGETRQTPVINFLDPKEIEPFSLGGIKKPKTESKVESKEGFWMRKPASIPPD